MIQRKFLLGNEADLTDALRSLCMNQSYVSESKLASVLIGYLKSADDFDFNLITNKPEQLTTLYVSQKEKQKERFRFQLLDINDFISGLILGRPDINMINRLIENIKYSSRTHQTLLGAHVEKNSENRDLGDLRKSHNESMEEVEFLYYLRASLGLSLNPSAISDIDTAISINDSFKNILLKARLHCEDYKITRRQDKLRKALLVFESIIIKHGIDEVVLYRMSELFPAERISYLRKAIEYNSNFFPAYKQLLKISQPIQPNEVYEIAIDKFPNEMLSILLDWSTALIGQCYSEGAEAKNGSVLLANKVLKRFKLEKLHPVSEDVREVGFGYRYRSEFRKFKEENILRTIEEFQAVDQFWKKCIDIKRLKGFAYLRRYDELENYLTEFDYLTPYHGYRRNGSGQQELDNERLIIKLLKIKGTNLIVGTGNKYYDYLKEVISQRAPWKEYREVTSLSILDADWSIMFGKYEELSIEEIIKLDIDYLMWCIKNIPSFTVEAGVFLRLQNELLFKYFDQLVITVNKNRFCSHYGTLLKNHQEEIRLNDEFHERLRQITIMDERLARRDTFEALTDGQLGDYEDFNGNLDDIDNWRGG